MKSRKNGIIKEGDPCMHQTLEKSEGQKLPSPEPHQTHDLRSLWNYFFDFGGEAVDRLQPKIDVTDEKDAVMVTAEIPGIKEENLDLKISDDGYLTISGEKEHAKETSSKNCYFSEISYGMFKRTIPLPFDLDYKMADADYDNGVLNIRIPKSKEEKQKYKKISVKKKTTAQQN
ncbi:MAG: Hsp20/alpha crystallin family protein [Alphaproteobacteria bacterium]|nr:Hsp20/alpha crystallin family protein [Alphaproteobacteria bacterium]